MAFYSKKKKRHITKRMLLDSFLLKFFARITQLSTVFDSSFVYRHTDDCSGTNGFQIKHTQTHKSDAISSRLH